VYFNIYVYTINVYIHKVIQMPLSRRLVSLQGGLLQRQKWSDEQSAELGCHHPPKQSRCESLSVTKQIQTARVFLDVSRLCSMASNGKYMSKKLQHKIWNKHAQSKSTFSWLCSHRKVSTLCGAIRPSGGASTTCFAVGSRRSSESVKRSMRRPSCEMWQEFCH